MYLIEIETLQLKEFNGKQIPPYAILSHRWGVGELTFKDVLKNRADKSSRGYIKMLGACRTAKSYKIGYVWIDTCCINKDSSAELSEAISSMFSWYRNAKICLAYLEDVDHDDNCIDQSFKNSVWFTRAWTLQELLAPQRLEFFDSRWVNLGSRNTLAKRIAPATRIRIEVLTRLEAFPPQDYAIAERMSWAANRKATRPEDTAYSLMGLFDVNMPLLYGEGMKAFIRLQEEIMRSSNDVSVLHWGFEHKKYQLLARSPDDFRDVCILVMHSRPRFSLPALDAPLHLTNIGLNIELKLYRWQLNVYAVALDKYWRKGRFMFHFLLLQRSSDWESVYAIRITEEEENKIDNSIWNMTKKLTIRRGLVGHENHQGGPRVTYPGNGFVVITDGKLCPVSPDVDQYHTFRAKAHWEIRHENSSYGLCKFSTARFPGIARFCIRSAQVVVWVNAYFDFDSRPCVFMCPQPAISKTWSIPKMPNHMLLQMPSLPTSSEDPMHSRGMYTCRRAPHKLKFKPVSYLLSAWEDSESYCEIPETKTWAMLRPPTNSSVEPESYWSIEFSSNEPVSSALLSEVDRF